MFIIFVVMRKRKLDTHKKMSLNFRKLCWFFFFVCSRQRPDISRFESTTAMYLWTSLNRMSHIWNFSLLLCLSVLCVNELNPFPPASDDENSKNHQTTDTRVRWKWMEQQIKSWTSSGKTIAGRFNCNSMRSWEDDSDSQRERRRWAAALLSLFWMSLH